jgi:hypothetical protein
LGQDVNAECINWEKVNAKLPVNYAGSLEMIPLKEAWFPILENGGNIKTAKGGEFGIKESSFSQETSILF